VFATADNSNEVYNQIIYDNSFGSILKNQEFIKGDSDLYYVNSFSKYFAMTGWRLGYCISTESNIKNLLKITQNTITNVSTFSQFGAIAALTEHEKYEYIFEEQKTIYSRRYHEIMDLFSKKNIDFIVPKGAFYFFINIRENAEIYANYLLENHNIAVVPGNAYGNEYAEYIRISFAVDDFSYQTFLAFVNKFW